MLSPPVAQLCEQPPDYSELSEIKGQETAKRVLEIAAAGGHNLFMRDVETRARLRGVV